jgi:hypothetical protein
MGINPKTMDMKPEITGICPLFMRIHPTILLSAIFHQTKYLKTKTIHPERKTFDMKR